MCQGFLKTGQQQAGGSWNMADVHSEAIEYLKTGHDIILDTSLACERLYDAAEQRGCGTAKQIADFVQIVLEKNRFSDFNPIESSEHRVQFTCESSTASVLVVVNDPKQANFMGLAPDSLNEEHGKASVIDITAKIESRRALEKAKIEHPDGVFTLDFKKARSHPLIALHEFVFMYYLYLMVVVVFVSVAIMTLTDMWHKTIVAVATSILALITLLVSAKPMNRRIGSVGGRWSGVISGIISICFVLIATVLFGAS